MTDDRSAGVPPQHLLETAEGRRLVVAGSAGWRAWGPYLSERQWGTVREDYSPGGTAWDYFPHDHARSRAYRWGEEASPASATRASAGASPWRSGTGVTSS